MLHKILFSGLILLVALVGMVFHHFSQTSDLLKKYSKFGLVQSDIKFEKVERSWGEQGLIFYQVQFPFINFPVQADKMKIHLSDAGMKLQLNNATINVTEGLNNIYGSKIMNNLNTYVPYKDFLNKILTSMALMGVDEFKGDIAVNTFYSDLKTMNFDIEMNQNQQSTIQMSGTIHIPIVGAHQISDLWNGEIDSSEIKVKESLFKNYVNYAKSRNIQLPQNIKDGILKFKKSMNPIPKLKSILE